MILIWDTEALLQKPQSMGWGEYRQKAGISVACTINYPERQPKFYTCADDVDGNPEYGIQGLVDDLESADLTIGYNTKWYDIGVLEAAIGRPLALNSELDIWGEIRTALAGARWPKGSWKLGRVAYDTLGVTKTADGAMAPTLWRRGSYGELFTYVHRDVDLCWQLFDHVLEHGYVLDPVGNPLNLDFSGVTCLSAVSEKLKKRRVG